MDDKTRNRKWCGTLNNWVRAELESLLAIAGENGYVGAGEEIGENGTPHLQFWLVLKEAVSFRSLRTKIPRAHFEVCKGSNKENYAYITKTRDVDLIPNEVVHERGVRPELTDTRGEAGKFVGVKPYTLRQERFLEVLQDMYPDYK